ncbi:MAG: NAD(P)H-dependent glycerol-3-phosphate dehydrogenase [Candidatus Limnocylindria bacterium]
MSGPAARGEVAVIQAGSWGTTLATILAREGRQVMLWTRDPAQAEEIAAHRENRRYLPGIRVPDSVVVTADLDRALAAPDLIVAMPTVGVGALRERVAPRLGREHRLLSATKGLSPDHHRRMSELWSEALGRERVAVLSGPNISREIAAGLPSPTVVASADPETARHFQALVGTSMFRAYTNDDVVGVELCGALKNIIALGAGAIDGMGYGENAKAGFMTRGLAEIARYAFAHGANPLTAAGLAGVGDLIATCTSKHSRNRTVGELLARGVPLDRVRERMRGQVAEGIDTTAAVRAAAAALGVAMPVTEQSYAVLFEGKPIREAMRDLMERERGEELSGPLADVGRLVAEVAARRRDPAPPAEAPPGRR